MKNEKKYAIEKFEDAFSRLKEGIASAKNELGWDGVVQRYEFTFELLWKTLKIFLNDKGIDARTPKDVFKEAFKLDWLEEEEVFLNMLEDRNLCSHVYDQQTSRKIVDRITKKYISAIETVLNKLRSI